MLRIPDIATNNFKIFRATNKEEDLYASEGDTSQISSDEAIKTFVLTWRKGKRELAGRSHDGHDLRGHLCDENPCFFAELSLTLRVKH